MKSLRGIHNGRDMTGINRKKCVNTVESAKGTQGMKLLRDAKNMWDTMAINREKCVNTAKNEKSMKSVKQKHPARGWTLAALVLALVTMTAFAGDLNAPAAPTDAGSAMFTLEDLYNRLLSGTAGSKRGGGFAEPGAAPAGTMHNLNQIMEKAPTVDAAGAAPVEVLAGKKYWSLTAGQWGPQTGTMAAGSISAGSDAVKGGFIATTTLSTIDTDLISDNIKSGVTLFGVTGKTTVVDTATGNATSGEILYGRQAFTNGVLATGTRFGGTVAKAGGSFSDGGRWYDNNDGTITDTTTGLIWLKNAGLSGLKVFVASNSADVFTFLGALENGTNGLSDGSAKGDWRLPTLSELQKVRAGTEPVTFTSMQRFTNVANGSYWTLSNGNTSSQVSVVHMSSGVVNLLAKNITANQAYGWPVRSK